MGPPVRSVTAAELGVLELLWKDGESTTRALAERLYGAAEATHYYTVQKLLERLEEKGCVQRNRQQRVHTFTASVERADLIGDSLRELSEKLCQGSVVPLMTELVRMRKLTDDEFRALQEIVQRIGPSDAGESSPEANAKPNQPKH